MIRRSKRKFKNGIINKKLILLLTVTCVTLGIGSKIYINKKNNNKNSLVYAGIKEKDNNSSSSGTSSGFTPKFKDEKSKEDEEEKKSNKHIDINTDTDSSKSNDRKKVVTPSEPNNPSEPNSNKSATSAKENTEDPKTKNYKEFFKNDVFMGDSITEALIYYEVLNEKNVCAKKGININNAKNEVEKINIQNPRNIYVLYGVNDMNNTVPSKWFVDHYRTLIHKVKEKFPKSNIYIQSVMPVLPMVEQKTPTMTNSYINECNLGLMKMAKEENVKFLNVNSILNESNKNLYEDDGIHFKPNFYPVWLNYIKNRVQ
ncbi:SGNH/GDSL hydrolase family protein [Clostridium cochlearium]|uniref:SGNH/GDSL hydrolase family protein n=1 Tax=Clostridium cochlearium TaxID=1494 RepID=UPI00313FF60A